MLQRSLNVFYLKNRFIYETCLVPAFRGPIAVHCREADIEGME